MNVNLTKITSRRLSIKLIVYFFIFSLLFTIIYSSLNLYGSYNSEIQKIKNTFVQIENSVLTQLSFSLWQMDDTQLKIQLDSVFKLPGVVYIEIIENDKSLISMGKKEFENFEYKNFDLIFSASGIENYLGKLYVQVSFKNINSKVLNDISEIIFHESLKFFILSIFLLIIVHKLIIRHIINMSKYTSHLDINSLHIPLKLDKVSNQNERDVLDILSFTINKMREKLLNYIEEKDKSEKQLTISNNNMKKEIENRIKIQEEIWLLNEQLEQKVLDRTREIENSNLELTKTLKNLKLAQKQLIQSEKMASLGDLVAGIAHEINTPVGIGVTGITHFLEITNEINKHYLNDNMSKEEFESYLKVSKELAVSINSNLIRASDLIKSFKQVAVDQSSEIKRTFNLKEYIDEIMISLRNITKNKKIKILVECPDDLYIDSYPGAFSQIITNLITNSFLHGYNKDDEGCIKIKISKTDLGILFNYSDDGKGIEKKNLDKIYDPFFTTNRANGGSGLGLNIIYNIISTHLNGTIKCNSDINKGVEFIIKMNLNTLT